MSTSLEPGPVVVAREPAPPRARGRTHRTRTARERWSVAAFLAPALVLVGVLLVLPFLATVARSFTDDNGTSASFVGFDNYTAMFTDPVFGRSLLNTVLWVIGSLVLPVLLGLAIAAGTWQLRLGALARFSIVLPYAVSGAATGII